MEVAAITYPGSGPAQSAGLAPHAPRMGAAGWPAGWPLGSSSGRDTGSAGRHRSNETAYVSGLADPPPSIKKKKKTVWCQELDFTWRTYCQARSTSPLEPNLLMIMACSSGNCQWWEICIEPIKYISLCKTDCMPSECGTSGPNW